MNKYRPGLLTVIASICFLACTLIIAQVGSSQDANNKKLQDKAVNQEEATRIQEGALSAKQRAHSKLFKHNGPKLKDLARQQKGTIEVVSDVGLVLVAAPSSGNPLEAAVCNADAVVVAIPQGKASQINEEGNFIFTDFEVNIEEVVKNNPASGIEPNKAITITRDGGAVEVGSRIFRARREDFKPTLIGKRYLFFLKFIPETQSYLAYGNGTFELDADKVVALGSAPELRVFNAKSATALLGEVRTFAATGCTTK